MHVTSVRELDCVEIAIGRLRESELGVGRLRGLNSRLERNPGVHEWEPVAKVVRTGVDAAPGAGLGGRAERMSDSRMGGHPLGRRKVAIEGFSKEGVGEAVVTGGDLVDHARPSCLGEATLDRSGRDVGRELEEVDIEVTADHGGESENVAALGTDRVDSAASDPVEALG